MKRTMSFEEQLKAEVKERQALESKLHLTLQLAEARQAMIDGRGQEAERQRQLQEAIEKEREKRIEHTKRERRSTFKRELTRVAVLARCVQ